MIAICTHGEKSQMTNSDYDLSPYELLRLERIKRNEAKW